MKFLLDTHILLWWLAQSRQLSKKTIETISNPAHIIFVSAATAWEIAIKKAIGKLEVPDDLEDALTYNRFQPLAISIQHALTAGALPPHHTDPFDRMLIAQADCEELTLITHDKIFSEYSTPLLLV